MSVYDCDVDAVLSKCRCAPNAYLLASVTNVVETRADLQGGYHDLPMSYSLGHFQKNFNSLILLFVRVTLSVLAQPGFEFKSLYNVTR